MATKSRFRHSREETEDMISRARRWLDGSEPRALHPEDRERFYRTVSEHAKTCAERQAETNERDGIPER